jgi:uncharacterized protein DUF6941
MDRKHIFTLVCDDIRPERGNKISLMGLYGDTVFVPAFPFVFPKLCILEKWENISDKKDFRAELSGEGISPVNLVFENFANEDGQIKKPHAQFVITIVNLNIPNPTTLKLKTYFEKEKEPAHIHTLKVDFLLDINQLK